MKPGTVFLRTSIAVAALCMAAGSFAAPHEKGHKLRRPAAARKYRSPAEHEAAAARTARFDNDRSEAQYMSNALARCARLPAADKQACERRIQGAGSRTGSVAAGGILREMEVRDERVQPSAPRSHAPVPMERAPAAPAQP